MEMLVLRPRLLFRHFPKCNRQRLHRHSIRYLSSPAAQPQPKPRLGATPQSLPPQHEQPALSPQRPKQEKKQLPEYQREQQPLKRERTWLTRQIETSPTAKTLFNALATVLGYSSPKQRAGRRAYVLYRNVCAVRPDEERDFWQKECHLPPTFQSWFTVANLHVWLLTCRLRALPSPHGKHYQQGLIDHFFIDIEDRIRAVLQPPLPGKEKSPYTLISEFYTNPYAGDGAKRPRGRAPDRLVTRQMKIFKEQWMGLGLSFDLALVRDDVEMAAAVWRNLLGARGARGITYPNSQNSPQNKQPYRRAVNLVGGEVVDVSKIDVDKEELQDDGSGVSDFLPREADKYVEYPEVMLDLVRYVRGEAKRLEGVSDEEIMGSISGGAEKVRFGKIKGGR